VEPVTPSFSQFRRADENSFPSAPAGLWRGFTEQARRKYFPCCLRDGAQRGLNPAGYDGFAMLSRTRSGRPWRAGIWISAPASVPTPTANTTTPLFPSDSPCAARISRDPLHGDKHHDLSSILFSPLPGTLVQGAAMSVLEPGWFCHPSARMASSNAS